ncbi:MAG: TetR family transcriptional regulator [Thermodesulfobacteriota bacterium]
MAPPETIPQKEPSTEERILAAARDEFAATGFYGARTQAIAEAAGVNKALLHYYFRSKENLYVRVIQTTFKGILTRVGQAWLPPGDLEIRSERVVDAFMDNYTKHPGFMKIVLREFLDGGQRFRQAIKTIDPEDISGQRLHPLQMIQILSRDLGLDPESALHFFVNVVGMCVVSFVSPLFLETVFGQDLSDFEGFLNRRRRAVKSMVVSFIRARLAEITSGAGHEVA